MAQIDIVVGTVYGAAMLVAETLAAQLEQAGHGCQVFEEAELADLDASRFCWSSRLPRGRAIFRPICSHWPPPWLTGPPT